MSTNSARTWAPAPVAVEPPPPVRRPGRSRTCTKLPRKHGGPEPLAAKDSERDMAQNILGLAKSIMRMVWGALTPAPAPAVQPRPQLNGRRGYGDDGVKPLDWGLGAQPPGGRAAHQRLASLSESRKRRNRSVAVTAPAQSATLCQVDRPATGQL